jgi:hypothetical protein
MGAHRGEATIIKPGQGIQITKTSLKVGNRDTLSSLGH